MENQQFIKQLQNRDNQAIEQLVVENRDKVFRTCLAYVQNIPDAEDLTQEVFIKVLEKLGQFKGDSKLSSWVIRIAINISINFLRDNKKRLNQLDASVLKLVDESFSAVEQSEVRKSVRQAIYKLPEKQRKVFILSFYLDLSYKEIAEVTDFSISSIESLLFRARKKLKDLLQEFYKSFQTAASI